MTAADWLLRPAAEPVTGDFMDDFYRAAREGQLELPVCSRLGHPLDFDQVRCEQCGSDAATATVWPGGTVLAVITMHRLEVALVSTGAPYSVFDVQLDSGHRLYLAMADPDGHEPVAGDPVNIGWVLVGSQEIPRILTEGNRSNR